MEDCIQQSGLQFCPLCNKPITTGSAYKRHIAYCNRARSKPRKRKRSCKTCHSAKARCSFEPQCSRCRLKGLQCVYEEPTALSNTVLVKQHHNPSKASTPGRENSGIVGSSHDDASELVPASQMEHHETAPTPDLDFGVLSFGSWPSLDPSKLDGSPRAIVEFQTDLVAQHNRNLLLESICALPHMMTRRETLPWFIHGHWNKSEPPRSIAFCIEMANKYVNHEGDTAKSIWPFVNEENRRFLRELEGYSGEGDRLASMQAQMMYMVMFALENKDKYPVPEVQLQMLMTFELYCKKLHNHPAWHTQPFARDEISEPSVTWEDWIHAETRRRSAIFWFLLSRVVDVRFGAICASITGYRNLPLPSPGSLWTARTREEFEAARELHKPADMPLMRTYRDLIDARSSSPDPATQRQLNEWHATCDKLGLLLTLATSMI
ncbi:hypothetical protein F5B20DRAFT_90544 [Whalleya microplaca]|nr:hypothetical protein F5B20DRAFT_90544 [Whalleya microplaca]